MTVSNKPFLINEYRTAYSWCRRPLRTPTLLSSLRKIKAQVLGVKFRCAPVNSRHTPGALAPHVSQPNLLADILLATFGIHASRIYSHLETQPLPHSL